jgi:hypothetical protein
MSAKSSLSEQLVERIAVLDAKIERLKDAIVRLQVRGGQTLELERSLVLLLETRGMCEMRLEQVRGDAGPTDRAVSPQTPHGETAEAERIRLDEPSAVGHWCAVFGCNEAELMQAVYCVGPLASAVNEYLAKATERARGIASDNPRPDD